CCRLAPRQSTTPGGRICAGVRRTFVSEPSSTQVSRPPPRARTAGCDGSASAPSHDSMATCLRAVLSFVPLCGAGLFEFPLQPTGLLITRIGIHVEPLAGLDAQPLLLNHVGQYLRRSVRGIAGRLIVDPLNIQDDVEPNPV